MSKNQVLVPLTSLDKLQSSGAGYDLLRYYSLPEILGTEANTLLYFMGRNLARKLDIKTIEDIYFIFDKLGWGKLELVKKKRKEIIFHLMADSVANRLNAPFESEFRLEAGFLAESIQIINEASCECMEEVNKKILQVEFTVIYTA
ncbi:YslB family protein [Virgibacillus ndiopensis]|uniref:YslB family protein n=1 Tax=Virgibacillus ndiopensis TaxID=2004408 RepID=UPI000C08480D|nr:YslB family protein [Virgibacillus ndiopensis]